MLNEGLTYKEIGEHFGISKSTISRIILENNLDTSVNKKKVNLNLKRDYFEKIDSAEKAYWFGFLFTDGSIGSKRNRISFSLQIKDKEILEKFQEDLGIDSKISLNRTCYTSEFHDTKMHDDLIKLGLLPNKTYACKHIPYESVPEEYMKAFILGLFDGDGTLTFSEDCSKDVTFGFCSYYESVVQDFQYLVDKYVLNKENHNKLIYTSAWHINWRGRLQVLKILDSLYESSPRHLKRKYDKYLILKDSLK